MLCGPARALTRGNPALRAIEIRLRSVHIRGRAGAFNDRKRLPSSNRQKKIKLPI
jgi:hypothetical protein